MGRRCCGRASTGARVAVVLTWRCGSHLAHLDRGAPRGEHIDRLDEAGSTDLGRVAAARAPDRTLYGRDHTSILLAQQPGAARSLPTDHAVYMVEELVGVVECCVVGKVQAMDGCAGRPGGCNQTTRHAMSSAYALGIADGPATRRRRLHPSPTAGNRWEGYPNVSGTTVTSRHAHLFISERGATQRGR